MTKSASAPARVLAVIALVLAFAVLLALFAAALGGGGSGGSARRSVHRSVAHEGAPRRKAPATYTVQSGDTLISIAHRTGVPVGKIERLNPGVDPQILIAGEELKLR